MGGGPGEGGGGDNGGGRDGGGDGGGGEGGGMGGGEGGGGEGGGSDGGGDGGGEGGGCKGGGGDGGGGDGPSKGKDATTGGVMLTTVWPREVERSPTEVVVICCTAVWAAPTLAIIIRAATTTLPGVTVNTMLATVGTPKVVASA